MKVEKVIFASDDSHFLDFWPLQAKICKEILNIEPVLFHITEEESDFYNDGYGLVKKIKKIKGINTGAQAAIGRMFFTKYFPNEVCVVTDIDLLLIDKNYLQNQIQDFEKESIVLYLSDAYDINRTESKNYLSQSHFPFIQEMYCYHYNAATGETFNKILNTDCTFKEYLNKHQQIGNKDLFWGVDEFYFASCINDKNHKVKIHKLKRGFSSPFICSQRIERHRFPVQLEWKGEIEAQQRDGIYNFNNLESDGIIDINLPRPYSKYKNAIEEVANIILNKYKMDTFYNLGKKHNTDKITHHRYDRFYPLFLESYRDKEFKLFEIGSGVDKASFHMWHEYFPLSSIYVMDILEEHKTERGIVFKGDQSKQEDLIRAIEKIGKCEVIIDDGSHIPLHQINTFNELFPNMLEYGGTYIIEDTETNYWNPKENLYGYQIGYENTIDYFSSYPHRINSEFCNLKNNFNISSITFAHNCIIIKKQTLEEIELTNREYRFKYKL